jgi:hypothetical protein
VKTKNTTKQIKEVKKAALEALKYSNVFSYPLSFYQIALYMGEKSNPATLEKALNQLKKEKKIRLNRGVYSLKGEKTVNWHKRIKESVEKREEYKKKLKLLEKIPWIKLLAITGSVAASNYEDDDIDVFIITEKNRLWVTRMFVVLYLKARNWYFEADNPKNKVCPNIYITTDNLAWGKGRRNLYIAQEIARMQPIINKSDTYQVFLSQNQWINKYLPNFSINKASKIQKSGRSVLDIVNRALFLVQKAFMASKITTEVVSHNLIHFNKNDKSRKILEAYNASSKL